jgi:N-acyl-D-aspartate/D-glutamate deacylase
MHDIVIRGGTVVDGTGSEPFEADVAIDGERITEVGSVADTGRREIDATGLLVLPGWVDAHALRRPGHLGRAGPAPGTA